jgi:IS30 family transposase
MNQLTIVERSTIYAFRHQGKSFRFIARELGRAASTILREFKRNLRPVHGYDAVDAQIKTEKRRKRPRILYKFKNEELKDYVVRSLKKKISPFQISGRIKLELDLSISHEAIYKFIYRDKLEGGDLWKNLRHKRRQRKPRIQRTKRPRIKNRTGIELRPKTVDLKSRFGDLEIDTMVGRNHQGAILTVVDRHTKFLWAKFIGRNTAENIRRAMRELLKNMKLKTITSDNGLEFSWHEKISEDLKADFYFADPYSSWQRGLNEHTNGLLRQYFPKKSYFNSKTLENLDDVVKEINDRPRQVLNFKTPKEALNSLRYEDILVKSTS